jgi:O-antigen/teichoic acid export membrane protein
MGLNKEARSVNASRNVSVAMINKILLLILTFASRKFFVEYIGVSYLGIHSLFANILTLLSMADLGLNTAMNVSLYKPIAENDTIKLAALMAYYKKLYNIIAVVIAGIGLCLTPFLKLLINLNNNIPDLTGYYLLFLSSTVISYLFVYKSAIINADQKNYIVNKISIFVNFVKVAMQMLVVIIFKQYVLYVIMEVLFVLFNNLLISYNADNMYPFLKEKHTLSSSEKKAIFSNISSVFLYKISYSLINGTDSILISIIVGTVSVGLYSNYLSITSNLEAFIAIIFSSLTAGVGNLIITAGEEKRYNTFKSMQMVSFWISGIVITCLLFLTQDFVSLWLGKEYVLDNIVLIAIVCNMFFSTCMQPVWTYREGTGMYAQIRYVMLVTAVLNLVLSVVLGRIWGLSGILFATAISKIATYFWYEPRILFNNFFNQKIRKYYIEYFKNGIALLLSIAICYLSIGKLTHVSIGYWLLKAIICLIIVNIIYLLIYFRTEEFKMLINKFQVIVRKKGIRI